MPHRIRVSIQVTGVVNATVDVEVNGAFLMTVHENHSDSRQLQFDPEESRQVTFAVRSHKAGPWKAHLIVKVSSKPCYDKEPSGHARNGGLEVFREECHPS